VPPSLPPVSTPRVAGSPGTGRPSRSPRPASPHPDDDNGIYVLPNGVPLDLTSELTFDWREGDLW